MTAEGQSGAGAGTEVRQVVRMPHPAAIDEKELMRSCKVRRTKRSGPGGQHRNKVQTAVVITHEPTGVMAQASEARSQEANRQKAIRRLRTALAIVHREPMDPEGYIPSGLVVSRREGGRLSLNDGHKDFPAVLAEALDLVCALRGDVGEAGRRMGLTTSQVVKLLSVEPEALFAVNRCRAERGLPELLARK